MVFSEVVNCFQRKHRLLQRAMKKLKDPASCSSFIFSFFFLKTSFLAVMKKAPDKKGLENSTLLNPSPVLFSTDGQAQSSVEELYSSKYIHICAGKKKKRKKKMEERY